MIRNTDLCCRPSHYALTLAEDSTLWRDFALFRQHVRPIEEQPSSVLSACGCYIHNACAFRKKRTDNTNTAMRRRLNEGCNLTSASASFAVARETTFTETLSNASALVLQRMRHKHRTNFGVMAKIMSESKLKAPVVKKKAWSEKLCVDEHAV